jgi:hypothetical protein
MQWSRKCARKRFHESISAAIFSSPRRPEYSHNVADRVQEQDLALYGAWGDGGYCPECGCDSPLEAAPCFDLILRWRTATELGALKTLRKLYSDTSLTVRLRRYDDRV